MARWMAFILFFSLCILEGTFAFFTPFDNGEPTNEKPTSAEGATSHKTADRLYNAWLAGSSLPHKRSPSDDTSQRKMADMAKYKMYVEKGEGHNYLVGVPETSVEQSPWTETSAFHKYGYVQEHRRTQSDVWQSLSSQIRILFKQSGILQHTGSDNTIYWDHERRVERPDKEGHYYLPTKGYFRNAFFRGAIVAQNQLSPTAAGKNAELHQVTTITGDEVVPFNHWSHVAFLSYKLFCQQQAHTTPGELDLAKVETCLKALRLVARTTITEKATEAIIFRALDLDKKNILTEDQVSFQAFPKLTKGAAAILGTPSGSGVAYLLLEHKEQLGRKVIKEIVISKSPTSPTTPIFDLVFVFADQPDIPGVRGDRGGQSEAPKPAPAELRPRQVDTYQDLQAKGRLLAEKLNSPESAVPQAKWTSVDFAKYGWEDEVLTDDPGTQFPLATVAMLKQNAVMLAGSPNNLVKWTHSYDTKRPGVTEVYKATHGFHQNVFCLSTIIIAKALSPGSNGAKLKPPVVGDDLIPFRHWSDVTFVAFRQWCRQRSEGDEENYEFYMKELDHIVVASATNADTDRTIKIALKRAFENLDGKEVTAEFTAYPKQSGEAAAILASPNGQGIVWFLAQHKKELGWKVVTEIVVSKDRNHKYFDILFVLGLHPSAPEAAVDKRRSLKQKRVEVQYSELVAKGKVLVAKLNRPEGSVGQATWTRDDLARNGWTTKLLKLDAEDYQNAQMLKFLKEKRVSLLSVPGNYIVTKHTEPFNKASGSSKKTRPSQGTITNMLFPGIIMTLDARTPIKAGERLNPPLKEEELPALKHWSDVTYLEWEAFCQRQAKMDSKSGKDLDTRVKELQYVVQTHVHNLATEQAVVTALGEEGKGTKGKSGITLTRTFEAHPKLSDEAAAILASPSGQGIAFLLSERRKQLGWKIVKSVVILRDPKSDLFDVVFTLGDRASSSASRSLRKRISQEYTRAVDKGRVMAQKVLQPENCVPQAQWTSEHLESQGWTAEVANMDLADYQPQETAKFFRERGAVFPKLKGTWVKMSHAKPFMKGNVRTRPTLGYYMLNFQEGLTVALDSRNPASEGLRLAPPIQVHELPALKTWSDLTFLAWKQFCKRQARLAGKDNLEARVKAKVKTLNYVVQHHVVNLESDRIVQAALGPLGQTMRAQMNVKFAKVFPVFPQPSNEAHAILGSPNGYGVAWLLSQHKREIGYKIIKEIVVIKDGKKQYFDIVFVLMDHPYGAAMAAQAPAAPGRAIAGPS